jgi:dGTPase
MRLTLEREEDARLAPYAARSARATRRYPLEDEGRAFDYRTAYQRDRDRVVYSRAFRRLRQKAVAGLLPAYEDHRRNRLTHTLEVAQMARTIARALRLNEDLVEAIALAHDLGQPPFAAAGERALDDLLSGRRDGHGGPCHGDLGGFSRSWQGLRVVDRLEKRYAHPGLNLTDDVREGIVKSGPSGELPADELAGVRAGLAGPPEAQVVSLSDRIATVLDDLDDALQAGAVAVADVERIQVVRELRRKIGARWPKRGGRFTKANAIHRGLTHLLVTGAILGADASLRKWIDRAGLTGVADFCARRDELLAGNEVSMTAAAMRLLEDLEGFVEGRVHRGSQADRVEATGRRAVLGLFAAFWADPGLLDDHVLLRFKETAGVPYFRDLPRPTREEVARRWRSDPRFARVLADHLAAMTDAYALAEHARLLAIGAVPIPSAEQLRREDRT